MTFGVLGRGGVFTPQGSFNALSNLAATGAGAPTAQQAAPAATELPALPAVQTQVPADVLAQPASQGAPLASQLEIYDQLGSMFHGNTFGRIGDYQVQQVRRNRRGPTEYSVTDLSGRPVGTDIPSETFSRAELAQILIDQGVTL